MLCALFASLGLVCTSGVAVSSYMEKIIKGEKHAGSFSRLLLHISAYLALVALVALCWPCCWHCWFRCTSVNSDMDMDTEIRRNRHDDPNLCIQPTSHKSAIVNEVRSQMRHRESISRLVEVESTHVIKKRSLQGHEHCSAWVRWTTDFAVATSVGSAMLSDSHAHCTQSELWLSRQQITEDMKGSALHLAHCRRSSKSITPCAAAVAAATPSPPLPPPPPPSLLLLLLLPLSAALRTEGGHGISFATAQKWFSWRKALEEPHAAAQAAIATGIGDERSLEQAVAEVELP